VDNIQKGTEMLNKVIEVEKENQEKRKLMKTLVLNNKDQQKEL
jgi:hypothetical protein